MYAKGVCQVLIWHTPTSIITVIYSASILMSRSDWPLFIKKPEKPSLQMFIDEIFHR